MLTPEWAFHHRETVSGSMMCRVELSRTSAIDRGSWTPDKGFGDVSAVTETLIYRGIARVQPNKDWRARKQEYETEAVVEHAYRIQLAFDGQELSGKGFPQVILPEDRVKVIEVASLRGVAIDPAIKNFDFIVRNSVAGSNYWVRTLLCDVLVDEQTNG